MSKSGGISSAGTNGGWQDQKGLYTPGRIVPRTGHEDSGGASRFFATFHPLTYQAKSSRRERNAGLDGFAAQFAPTMGNGIGAKEHDPITATPKANSHPCVKPIALMRYLCRLITPPGGTILDPFCGSGSTGCAAALEGFDFVGIEREPEYVAIAKARIAYWAMDPKPEELAETETPTDRQLSLL